jgi:hypothetical protein
VARYSGSAAHGGARGKGAAAGRPAAAVDGVDGFPFQHIVASQLFTDTRTHSTADIDHSV